MKIRPAVIDLFYVYGGTGEEMERFYHTLRRFPEAPSDGTGYFGLSRKFIGIGKLGGAQRQCRLVLRVQFTFARQ
jgi:hypothetical protein